jgi:hypothetical protein
MFVSKLRAHTIIEVEVVFTKGNLCCYKEVCSGASPLHQHSALSLIDGDSQERHVSLSKLHVTFAMELD